MTTKIVKLGFACALLTLASCRYSNEFTGTYNQQPATLSAFSKNTDKFCIDLTLKSNSETKTSQISARAVYDENDFQRTKSFNTKTEACGSKLPEYLVGSRSTKIVQVATSARQELSGGGLCHLVFYPQYFYQEMIQFEFRNRLTDQTTGSFAGEGIVDSYVDYTRPSGFGPYFPCNGVYPRPYPGYPNPGFPGYPPFPRTFSSPDLPIDVESES